MTTHKSEAGAYAAGWFQRIGLPIVLIAVALITLLLVLNAFEATDLMADEGRAAPTMLNPDPQ